MSVATEISRLQTAKSDIKTAIEAKGVTVPSSAKIDVYDDYISQISTGKEKKYDNVTPGVYAYYVDGSLKTLAEVQASPSGQTAVGVAIISSSSKFVLQRKTYMEAANTQTLSEGYYQKLVSAGVNVVTDYNSAISDFNGYKNYYGILSCNTRPKDGNWPLRTMFDGRIHVPSTGQAKLVFDNLNDIKNILNAVGEYSNGSPARLSNTTYGMVTSTVMPRNSSPTEWTTCDMIIAYADGTYSNVYSSYELPDIWLVFTLDYDYDNKQHL